MTEIVRKESFHSKGWHAIIAMLMVYCLKGTSLLEWPYGLPELIAVAAVVMLHLWKKNTLLSIGVGTVLYMLLVQFVFIT